VVAGVSIYRIYNDWFDEPAISSGKLIGVEAHFDGGSYRRPNKYNLVLRLDNSDKQWSTKSIFTEDEMPQYLEAFSQYVGQNLTISYSPRYLTLINVKNEAGQSLFPP